MSQSDPLYAIFEKHLFSCLIEDETSDQLIYKVVADYLDDLMKMASIPVKVAEFVENDLRDEVRDMLRKKTYGYMSLTEFRQAQTKTSKSKAPRRLS
jgi:hypothetical protein